MKREPSSSQTEQGGFGNRTPPAIPDHEMLRRIGGGSYGEVWLARHKVLNDYRAVKIIYRANFFEDRPFERELEGIKRFEPISRAHPSQLGIFQVGRDDKGDFFYYAMELADDQHAGQHFDPDHYQPRTLRSELEQRGHLPFKESLDVGCALAAALEHLHASRSIHRDIKPANVIFVRGQPKLADIGLVAAADEDCTFVGTEGYAAPEGPGKRQSDIYSLGKVLYQMTTGFHPKENFPRIPDGWDKASDSQDFQKLNHVVMRACEGNPCWRYRTAGELREDLEMLAIGRSLLVRQYKRKIQRMKWWLAAAATAVVFLLLSLTVWYFENSAKEEARRRELRDIRISRLDLVAGWSDENWERLRRAAAIRTDQEVLERATALLAGLDAKPVKLYRNLSAGSAAFAMDGRALLGGVNNSQASLINTNGAQTELPVRGEGPVCWTPEAVPLQFVAVSNLVVMREARTGRVLRVFPLPPAKQSTSERPILATTPDGARLGVGLNGRLLVWKTATADKLGEVAAAATALAFTPDGSMLAAGSSSGMTVVYTIPGLAQLAVLPPALRGNPILCLAFGHNRVVRGNIEGKTDSWLLATGDQGAGIVIWDLDKKLPRSFCLGSPWDVLSLVFHPDGLTLASAGRNEARLWDVTSGQLLLRIGVASSGDSRALAFDKEGGRLVFGGDPGAGGAWVGLWELEPHRGIHVLRGLASSSRKVWFSSDSRRIAALSDGWHLGVWEIASGHLLNIIETPVGVLADNAGGCFDVTGKLFAFAAGNLACLYDVDSGQRIQRWILNNGLSDQLQFDSRGRLLLLRREHDSEERVSIWRLFTLAKSQAPILLQQQHESTWNAAGMAFRPDGEQFLVWNRANEPRRFIRAYDVNTGREVWNSVMVRTNGELRVCTDPTGRWFGYFGYDDAARLRLMDFQKYEEFGATTVGYEAISPSGQAFAGRWGFYPDTTGLNHAIPLAKDWHPLGFVWVFSPNGRHLACGTVEGAVLVSDLPEVERRLSLLRSDRIASKAFPR